MNWAYAHLVLNHIPVLGVPFGLILLCAGALRKSDDLKRAALVALVVVALSSLGAYFTGEPAEDTIEGVPTVSGPAIEEHEESAAVSLAVVEVLGVAAIVGLLVYWKRGRMSSWLLLATIVLALAGSVLMARTANLGGRIHHPEVRPGFSPAPREGKHGDE